MSMYNGAGDRKYLTARERNKFLFAAEKRCLYVNAFCYTLAITGCRISEALSLSAQSVDFEAGNVVIQCLKKRGKTVFRTVPVSPDLLTLLREMIVGGASRRDRLWPWSRMTGYRRVQEVMRAAGICGPHATPRGLRHAFGVCAIQSNVPLNLIQRWLGHADLNTTAIYADAVGPEEREFASRTWARGAPHFDKRPRMRSKRAIPDSKGAASQGSSKAVSPNAQIERSDRSGEGEEMVSATLIYLGCVLNRRVTDALTVRERSKAPRAVRRAAIL